MDRNHRSQPQHPLYLGQVQAYQIPVDTIKAFEGDLAIDWSQLTSKPTTLAGYGITDAYTKAQVDALFTAAGFGAGTASVLPKWSDSDTLTNSLLTEGTDQITLGSAITFKREGGGLLSARITGADNCNFGSGTGFMVFSTGGVDRFKFSPSGHMLAEADNTYDIGANGANRPRDLFLGRDIYLPTVTANGAGTVTISNLRPAAAATATISGWVKVKIAGTDSYIPFWR